MFIPMTFSRRESVFSLALDIICPSLPVWMDIHAGRKHAKVHFFESAPKEFFRMKQEVVTNGKHSLLVSGYWGASRHINYMGEIIQAIAIVAGYPAVWQVWLYPVYYIGLFFTRQIDNDVICRVKYGDLWNVYKKKVKHRIIPFVQI